MLQNFKKIQKKDRQCKSDARNQENCAISVKVTTAMIPIIGIKMICEGKDQGWGNTNQSRVGLVVTRAEAEKPEELVRKEWTVNAEWRTFEYTWDESTELKNIKLSDLKEGDEIKVLAISAPYSGFESHCKNAVLVITGGYEDKNEEETKLTIEPAALNDSALGGIDRLGYSAYAESIVKVLERTGPPMCIGLYAKWGSGKSFLLHLLKKNFDPSATEDEDTKEIRQWFEEGWIPPNENKAETDDTDTTSQTVIIGNGLNIVRTISFLGRCVNRLRIIGLAFPSSYTISTLLSVASDIPSDVHESLLRTALSCYHGELIPADALTGIGLPFLSPRGSYEQVSPEEVHVDMEKGGDGGEKDPRIEHVFVDFNAWEFSKSDELWAGLIRNLYSAVELRFQKNPLKPESKSRKDWKLEWRVKKAKKELVKRYGANLSVYMIYTLLLLLGIVVVLVLSVLGRITFWVNIRKKTRLAVRFGAGLVGFIVAFVPGAKLLFSANKNAETSRGDVIFAEASQSIQDHIGFLSRVRGELDELFHFIDEFRKVEEVQLRLVLFVDDLDRCLEGRNVKVLEAIQLLLAIPGAPIIVFMAIDARVVVASIEATVNKSLRIEDALISGWEYMDKIVQLPFCVPEPPPEKLRRLVKSCVMSSSSTLKGVANYLRKFITKLATLPGKKDMSLSFVEELTDFRNEESADNDKIVGVVEFLNLTSGLKNEDLPLLIACANAMTDSTKHGLELRTRIPEGTEILCQRVYFALESVKIVEKPKHPVSSPRDADHVRSESSKAAAGEDEDDLIITNAVEDSTLQLEERLLKAELKEELPMPNAMLHVLSTLSTYIPNPRRMKRIVNVVQIVCEVGQRQALEDMYPDHKLQDDPRWEAFSVKIVKWLILCECYPYRMSFLIHLLMDQQQKFDFNITGGSSYKYLDEEKKLASVAHIQMPLSTFYLTNVDKYIYSIQCSEKLLLLDDDPEIFVTLLSMGMEIYDRSGKLDFIDIETEDVLGPGEHSSDRDRNFSLLSYSFNLNPSLRRQIAADMSKVLSDFELLDPNGENHVLRENSIRWKKSFLESSNAGSSKNSA